MAKKKYAPRHDTGELFAKDDLQRINGIGPAVEKRLNGVGIFTFAQLAALSPADIAAAIADLSGLSAERIIKQDWIGQTRILAAESVASEAQQDVKAPLEEQDLALIHRVGLQQVDQPASGSLSSKAQQNTEVLEVTEQFHVHSEEPPFLDTEEPDQVLAVIAERGT